jgi:hypothetical protein
MVPRVLPSHGILLWITNEIANKKSSGRLNMIIVIYVLRIAQMENVMVEVSCGS